MGSVVLAIDLAAMQARQTAVKGGDDRNGAYEIRYEAGQFRRADKAQADLIVRAFAATGARLAAQLADGLRERPEVRYGLTALCIGMGMGAAVLWESLHHR